MRDALRTWICEALPAAEFALLEAVLRADAMVISVCVERRSVSCLG